MNETPYWERPCAAAGLTSYRYHGRFGYIMISATSDDDAIREANRSLTFGDADYAKLERWNGERYVFASGVSA